MRSKVRISAFAVVAVTAALLIGAATASAKSAGSHIFNLGGNALKITDLKKSGQEPVFEQSPTAPAVKPYKDMVLPIGEELHVEIDYAGPFNYKYIEMTLGIVKDDETVTPMYEVTLGSNGSRKCKIIAQTNTRCLVDGDHIEILDATGTEHRLSGEKLPEDGDFLSRLCTQKNECHFKETKKPSPGVTQGKIISKIVANCTPDSEVNFDFIAADKVATSTSWGIKVNVESELWGIFKFGVSSEFKRETTTEKSYEDKVSQKVKPRHEAWVEGKEPVMNAIGNFELEIGGSKWLIEGMTISSPLADAAGNFTVEERSLTPKKLGEECERLEPLAPATATLVAPAALHRTTQGTEASNYLYGGAESNALLGLGGNDILRGGGGDDTLAGGVGNDLVIGGAGEDVLRGGPGADRIVDLNGPATVYTGSDGTVAQDFVNVADGHADDHVICGSSNVYVLADSGDEITGPCGRVVYG